MVNTQIQVNPQKVLRQISPYLTGACIEDVNHEVYGGIFSQMIYGESFEEEPMRILLGENPAFQGLEGTVSCLAEREYLSGCSEIRSWQPFRKGSACGRLKATHLRSRRGHRSQRIEFLEGEGEVGIENQGLNRWGMNFVQGREYEGLVVLCARLPKDYPDGFLPVTVSLESADGSCIYAQMVLPVPADQQWHSLPFTLISATSDSGGRFSISLRQPGTLWVDYALLQPGGWGRFRGTAARKDIGEALQAQGLTVMRYGGYMINTDWAHEQQAPGSGYRWKKMIGSRQDRPPYRGTFYRYDSNGFGIFDFLQFCRTAGFLAIPAINPQESLEDLEDFLEYANGSADTPWGARRVSDGYGEPFGLRYLEIGNEENSAGLVNMQYVVRIRQIIERLWAKDPSVTPILGAGVWASRSSRIQEPLNREYIAAVVEAVQGFKVLWDVHVDGDALDDAVFARRDLSFLRRVIDEIDPHNQVGLCVLEENGLCHDLQRALGHVHNILTFEQLGGVTIDCAANCLQPWQQHDNYWDQGQLFFTPSQVWGMPPYYAQQMLARAYEPHLVQSSVEGGGGALCADAARSEDGSDLVVKVLNLGEVEVPACVIVESGTAWDEEAQVTCLMGGLEDANSPDQPEKIKPEETAAAWDGSSLERVFPAHSFTVIRFKAGMR